MSLPLVLVFLNGLYIISILLHTFKFTDIFIETHHNSKSVLRMGIFTFQLLTSNVLTYSSHGLYHLLLLCSHHVGSTSFLVSMHIINSGKEHHFPDSFQLFTSGTWMFILY